ncbi:MAG: shikimate dehydrogenase, partial [Pirellulales bacterium]
MVSQSLQEICCCLGQPVSGNPTQYMMEKAFARAGLDWRYLTLEVGPASLRDAIRGIRAMGFRGANLTIPHKVAVIDLLDDLSEPARLIGAVNCVNRQGDQLIGENTDGKGFLSSLRKVTDPAAKRVVVIGAGGAARAIAVELGLADVTAITIVNRSAERGSALAQHVEIQTQVPARFEPFATPLRIPEETDILINATSIGMGDPRARLPIAAETLRASSRRGRGGFPGDGPRARGDDGEPGGGGIGRRGAKERGGA